MSHQRARAAAEAIWASWESGQRLERLPDICRPRSLEEGYAAQAMLEEVSGSASVGWKIAATNVTGQRHIGVDAPLGGRLLAVFQPHLYSRTAAHGAAFGAALGLADQAWVLPVYGAREEPVEGVDASLVTAVDPERLRLVSAVDLDEAATEIVGAPTSSPGNREDP